MVTSKLLQLNQQELLGQLTTMQLQDTTLLTQEALTFVGHFSSDNTGTGWEQIYRTNLLFDTSTIPDDATVTAATVEVVVTAKTDTLSVGQSTTVVSGTPASNTALTTADFDQFGTTHLSNDVTIASVTADSSTL